MNRPASSPLRTAVLVLGVVVAGPGAAAAQTASAAFHADLAVARWFAPILWPAAYETIFPTIPHALAFDGRDNNGDGRMDLEDPFEAGFEINTDVLSLIQAFQALPVKPPRRVVYASPRGFVPDTVDVLEYWLYYLYDQGPGSHVHDPEHTFLFLDVADRTAPPGALRRYDAQVDSASLMSNAVRVVVGAAHEGSTAGNILAATRAVSPSRIFPRRLPTHVPLLAELGKHASAPDLHLDGRFDPGMDANLFRGSLWGLRDSFASGLNELGATTFESWQSFPRLPEMIALEDSYFTSTDLALRQTYQLYGARLDTLDQKTSSYSLFPMEDLEQLHALLRAETGAADVERQVLAFLEEHRSCFWGDAAGAWSGRIAPGVLPLMRQWAAAPPRFFLTRWLPRPPDNELWNHADHRRPGNVFKLHLFPRVAFGVGLTDDFGRYTSIKRLALEVADIPWPTYGSGLAGLLFPGRLFPDSRLEISLLGTEGPQRNWAYQYNAFTWKKGRGNRAGYYLGFQLRKQQVLRGDLLSDESLADISYETGIDVDVLKTRIGGKGIAKGVRTGLFLGHTVGPTLGALLPRGARIEGQFGVVLELEPAHSDVERALGARPNIRFQWGATILWNSPIAPVRPWNY